LPGGEHRDEAGAVRLVTRAVSWDDCVRLSFEEIRGDIKIVRERPAGPAWRSSRGGRYAAAAA
jgi:hypothetical protein